MAAIPKNVRPTPPRRFENYVLTREVDSSAGLMRVRDDAFTTLIGPPDFTFSAGRHIGQGWCDEGYSFDYPIGFDFEFDGIIYNKFGANTNGWMALVDPTLGTFYPFAADLVGQPFNNSLINPTFSTQAVLLAPWFDDLRNIAEDPTTLMLDPAFYSTTKIKRIRLGLESPPAGLNAAAAGVRYCNINTPSGRCLIVRWNSLSNFHDASTIIKFEVVLYENGTIEYRYAPKSAIALKPVSVEGATIGIFMPNGTNRFRDFAIGLGYREGARQEHMYGGFVYNSQFTDAASSTSEDFPGTAYYAINLTPFNNWPGQNLTGAKFVFAPPMNRRKILPRSDVRKTASLQRSTGEAFDDRKAITFVTQSVVNYPTTLQRFYANTLSGVSERQDLFFGDFELTASTVASVIDQFIDDDDPNVTKPFSDNDAINVSSAFASGSNLDALGDGLSQPLRSKTQLKLSFEVDINTTMLPTASCIYYYNVRSNSWNVPQNSSYVIGTSSGTPPAGAQSDIASVVSDYKRYNVIEDQRAFGPVSNVLSSGSHVPSTINDQTDFYIGQPYNSENATNAVCKSFSKSVQANASYSATKDETFALPITDPFVIEKAIIELPVAMGDGWFKNMTTSFIPLQSSSANGSTSFDFAGPALTIALFNQIRAGANTRLDLIMTGTVTHTFDNTSQLVMSNFPGLDNTFQVRPTGFLAYASTPASIITPVSTSNGYAFTGSIRAECVAATSSGVTVKLLRNMLVSSVINKQGVRDLFSTQKLKLTNVSASNYMQSASIAYVHAMGRSSTGFEQSGRSLFGKEITSFNGFDMSGKINNPFFIEGSISTQTGAASKLPTQFEQAITIGSNFRAVAAIQLESHQPSPYVVYPGDSLVIALSKTRPFLYTTGSLEPYTSGSIIDDVQLITGSINIVLYGSYVKEGKERHG